MKTRIIRFLLNFVVSLLLIAVTAEYGGERLGVVEALEKQSYDWRLKRDINPPKRENKRDNIVIIDVDADSVKEREKFTKLVSQLFTKYNPLAVGFALPFSEKDDAESRVLEKIDADFKKNLNVYPNTYPFAVKERVDELREEADYDRQFAEALRGHNVVLGYVFKESGQDKDEALPSGQTFVRMSDKTPLDSRTMKPFTEQWKFFRGFSANLREFMEAVQGDDYWDKKPDADGIVRRPPLKWAGHLNQTPDADGVVRRMPLFIERGGGGYSSSLPIILLARSQISRADFSINAVVEDGTMHPVGISGFSFGAYGANLNSDGGVFLRFLGKGGKSVDFDTVTDAVFRYVPADEVIAGVTPKKQLDGKIVLVGSSSPQLGDLYATPVNIGMPGVELMATQMANLIDGKLLSREAFAPVREMLTLAALLFVLSVVFIVLNPLLSFFLTLAVVGGYVFFALGEWENNIVWSIVPTVMAVVGLYAFTLISGFVVEWRASRHLRNTFSQYVPPEFAKQVGQVGMKINLDGEERELTVMFSDVRNFTSIIEKLTPEQLSWLMDKMLTAQTREIDRHNGTVDKFIGDAVMAFWNAPIIDEDHATKAVLAALDMQKATAALTPMLKEEGFQPIEIGIGLCTGNAIVGKMGPKERKTYTAIGDTVNLSSRTEGLTKYYKTPILVTETTYEQCKGNILFRAVDLVRVKGREQPVVLYEPLGQPDLVEPEHQSLAREFEEFRQTYHGGDFVKAAELLATYRQKARQDGLAEVYAERLEILRKEPPAAWDGVYVHQEK